MIKKVLLLVLLLFIIGCNDSHSGHSNSHETMEARSWEIIGKEALIIGQYGDNFAYDGEGVREAKGAITINVDSANNKGSVNALLTGVKHQFSKDTTFEGDVKLVMNDFHGMEPFMKGGVAENLMLHGDTGQGPPVMPKVLTYLGGWGHVDIYVNDKLVEKELHGHFMVTQQARKNKKIVDENGKPYNPTRKAESGFIDLNGKEVHLVAHTTDVDENNFPKHTKWIHLNFQDVEIVKEPKINTDDQESSFLYTFAPNKVVILDPKNAKVVKEITEGLENTTFAEGLYVPFNKKVFVNDRKNSQVIVINTITQKVDKKIPIGERPVHMFHPLNGNEIWSHSDAEGAFYVIDINKLEVTNRVVAALNNTGHGKMLWSHELGNTAFATNTNDDVIHVIDLSKKISTGTIKTCKSTHGVSYSEISNNVYIACGRAGEVSIVDPVANKLIKNVEGGGQVYPGAHEPHLSHNEEVILTPVEGKVNVIDVRNSEVIGNIKVNGSVGNTIFHKLNGKTYAFAPDGNLPFVHVFDVDQMKHIKRIAAGIDLVGAEPIRHGTSSIASDKYFVVMRQIDGYVSIVDMDKQKITELVEIGKGVSGGVFVDKTKT